MIDEKDAEIREWESKLNDMTNDFTNILKNTMSKLQDRTLRKLCH